MLHTAEVLLTAGSSHLCHSHLFTSLVLSREFPLVLRIPRLQLIKMFASKSFAFSSRILPCIISRISGIPPISPSFQPFTLKVSPSPSQSRTSPTKTSPTRTMYVRMHHRSTCTRSLTDAVMHRTGCLPIMIAYRLQAVSSMVQKDYLVDSLQEVYVGYVARLSVYLCASPCE